MAAEESADKLQVLRALLSGLESEKQHLEDRLLEINGRLREMNERITETKTLLAAVEDQR
jgi:CHASE3 domain sensor protein